MGSINERGTRCQQRNAEALRRYCSTAGRSPAPKTQRRSDNAVREPHSLQNFLNLPTERVVPARVSGQSPQVDTLVKQKPGNVTPCTVGCANYNGLVGAGLYVQLPSATVRPITRTVCASCQGGPGFPMRSRLAFITRPSTHPPLCLHVIWCEHFTNKFGHTVVHPGLTVSDYITTI